MAHEVVWSPEAVEDDESIGAYIQRDCTYNAQAVVGKIVDVAMTLADFPKVGRMVPELEDPSALEYFVYSCRLIDRVESSRVLIAAVIHRRRLLEVVNDRY